MKRPEFLETKRTPRYSLRKLNVGVASVLLGVTIFGINFTDHSVKAATTVESVRIPNGLPTGNLPQTSAVVLKTKVQQSSASNNATANNSTEAATTSQSAPKTQGSADTDIKSSTATNLVAISGTDRNAAAKLAAMNLVAIPSTNRNAAGTVAPFFYNLSSLGTGTQPAKENQDLANKTNLTSSDNYSSNIYKGADENYYKIVTIYGQDFVYRAADIQANGINRRGYLIGTAEDTKNNIDISKEDLGNGKTRWTVTFFPKMGLQNADSNTLHGLISAKFGIALTNDYQIVGNVDMDVINNPNQTYTYYKFEDGSNSYTYNTVQNPPAEVKFSFNPNTDVDPRTGLINGENMPAYNNKYLQGSYYFTTATSAGAKNLWQTYFKYADAYKNVYGSPYIGGDRSLNFNIFKIANKTGVVDGAKYEDPIIYDKLGYRLNPKNGIANSNGVFSSDSFNQAMEFKSHGYASKRLWGDLSQYSSYVISFTTQHSDSHEVDLSTGPKNQQFSGISANIYSHQNSYWNMFSRLYGEQRALKAKGDSLVALEAKDIIPNWDAKKAANAAVDAAVVKQKALINNANNLNDGEKQDLNNQVAAAATNAKKAIDAATTNDGATKAGQDGVAAIEKVVPTSLADAKQAANQVVEDALAKKLDEIKAKTNLTDDEKSKLTTEANTAAKDAQD
ncbi:LEA family epithelial adhesin, partial [Limosilactobacillus vaginalis]|uniref:LEA family epithelial adhesin n=1 Tax=Limosilactobacillus vaginalis TaxID=1633 RepID=UPI003AB51026